MKKLFLLCFVFSLTIIIFISGVKFSEKSILVSVAFADQTCCPEAGSVCCAGGGCMYNYTVVQGKSCGNETILQLK